MAGTNHEEYEAEHTVSIPALSSTLGKNLRAVRHSLGWTQDKVAELIGVSVEFYGRMERGKALPSLETFWRMTLVMATSADGLLWASPPPSPPLPSVASESSESPEISEIMEFVRNHAHSHKVVDMILQVLERELAQTRKLTEEVTEPVNEAEPESVPRAVA